MNNTIRACLDECYSASNPLAAMAGFIRRLRSNPAWREAEIEELEQTVRRVLRAVVVRHPADKLSPVPRARARMFS